MSSSVKYTIEDVARHNSKTDLWVAINGKVYDITTYVRDHPGGADLLCDVAGTDATAAYEDVGHSEDADEILATYLVGTLEGEQKVIRPKTVRVIQAANGVAIKQSSTSAFTMGRIVTTIGSVGGLSLIAFLYMRGVIPVSGVWSRFLSISPDWVNKYNIPKLGINGGGFVNGCLSTTGFFTALIAIGGSKVSNAVQIKSGFTNYPPHLKSKSKAVVNPHLVKGFLEPKEFKELSLIEKHQLSPNVYRFVFKLPGPRDIIGLPIGQHVAIKATIDGQTISRSYTPTSNNMDAGVLELVIKCYPDGLLTGKYLAHLEVGNKVLFRGPKGAMKYEKGICQHIGMIAGGTGITPMYQLIRAICEDETDTTQISLIYANRSEEDILLRKELETFARKYPKNLKIWYMLDHPPRGWKYGSGYVTAQIMAERLPAPSPVTKIMLCGPPGMVNASKKALGTLGYEAPGPVSKMTDQIFCF